VVQASPSWATTQSQDVRATVGLTYFWQNPLRRVEPSKIKVLFKNCV
jgi:hypothetical protein